MSGIKANILSFKKNPERRQGVIMGELSHWSSKTALNAVFEDQCESSPQMQRIKCSMKVLLWWHLSSLQNLRFPSQDTVRMLHLIQRVSVIAKGLFCSRDVLNRFPMVSKPQRWWGPGDYSNIRSWEGLVKGALKVYRNCVKTDKNRNCVCSMFNFYLFWVQCIFASYW